MLLRLPNRNIALASVLIFVLGYTIGNATKAYKLGDVPIRLIENDNNHIGVVELEGIFDGDLKGSITGDTRVFLGENQIIPNTEGEFKVRADDLFINYIQIKVPEGMKFVASKRGKYYYSVTSSAGEGITPGNRVYFSDAEEAKDAGYLKKN
ncbi:hypothetical protein KJ652_06815 [Patescibacteria group bacterium]|nr:hypothetical protein [Patescibacteria group bacterium]MBU1124261.1 hypothetical protein [Patescibacteria group bacterium]